MKESGNLTTNLKKKYELSGRYANIILALGVIPFI